MNGGFQDDLCEYRDEADAEAAEEDAEAEDETAAVGEVAGDCS
jgi:hypothetical protein